MKRAELVVRAMLVLAGMVFAPPVLAGDLNPPGPPASTMKTLDEIPGSWHRILLASERFVLVMNDQAVLDKETGLVWERSPGAGVNTNAWVDAIYNCFTMTKGERRGWRLPTIEELSSLVDPTVFSGVRLPAGHPFINVQSYYYWSATTHATNSANAWIVHFGGSMGSYDKTSNFNWWCVRGGRSDGQ